ncbi:hypothetical protein F5Y00DRAFT_143545 [Daldinia vernicosa]|uniref:uncharacterized protein n=1 Tax=Daldinia vernicosa TaxID=114800 RepID=UPI00200839E5|nr:uncharacterized protein F5Y00DRAFT_143545 [Daldinia vernicosa]KAI0846525.1 hypothetical protein F5Y00DRAFT_143545 [Daldinia vernicosa]
MSRRNSGVSEDNRIPRSRTISQRNHKSPHSQPRSPRPSSHNKSLQNPTNSQAHNPSPLKMVTTTSTTSHNPGDETLHYYLPDTNAREAELQKQGWMEPIVIDDEDLMFSGKSLSAWYEEERKSIGGPVEEERRGRQRVRQHNSHTHHPHHHHNHHHNHHNHNHHRHHPSSTTTPSNHEQNKH